MMLQHKLRYGATAPEIAQEFGVSTETVKRELSYAKKAGLIVDAEDRILQELVPSALDSILTALKDTEKPHESAKIGLDLLKGILPSFSKKQGPAAPGDSDDELQRYIASVRAAAVESEVVNALPPAEAQAPPQRLPEPDRGEPDRDVDAEIRPQAMGDEVI